MKYVGAIRKELGFRTVFNILGPLTNPGSPKMRDSCFGVYDEYLVEPLAQVLIDLGVKRGMVVYGKDKLDEISMSAPTKVCEFKDGWFRSYTISPERFRSDLLREEGACRRNTGGERRDNPRDTRRREGTEARRRADERRSVALHRRQSRQYHGGRNKARG